ncbi:MAG: glycosyltransferase family 2 protein [Methanobacterium sp.]|jgi:GT2 family glycosyltransferase
MNPLVAIIILNWNGWPDTLECLESLFQINYPNFEVILVDNNSQDQSIQKIKEYCQGEIQVQSPFFQYQKNNKPIKIKLITNEESKFDSKIEKDLNLPSNQKLTLIKNYENYGFAKGNNIAIKYSLQNLNPDYIFLLNNDTVVNPDFLTKMIQSAEEDVNIGILGPLIYYYDWNGRSNVVANLGGKVDIYKYPGYYDLIKVSNPGDYSENIIECDWVSGAALMMKISDMTIKYLNEKLFFGCEDIDLAILLKKQGYKSIIVLNSHIWHKEGVSRKKRSSDSIKRALMEIKSNLTFLKAHNPYYYQYLPLYILQVIKIYLLVIIRR